MNPNPKHNNPPATSPIAPRNDIKDTGDKLVLTPEQAEREKAKLREYREDLSERKTVAEGNVRTTPIARRTS